MGKSRKLVLIGAAVVTAGALTAGGMFYVNRTQTQTAACSAITDLEAANSSRRLDAAHGSGPKIAFLGDSYTEGQHLDDPLKAFPYVAAAKLGDAPLVNGRGGSGFVYDGPCADSKFLDRVNSVMAENPAIAVVQGGINDLGRDGQEQAARELLSLMHQRLPNAHLILVGPAAAPGVDRAKVDQTTEGMQRAAEAVHATFVDLRNLPLEFLPDKIHATEASHRIIGEAVASAAH
jgi:lysophospholipase L1-like esterase